MDHSAHMQTIDSDLTESNPRYAAVYGADDLKVRKVWDVHGMGAAIQVIVGAGGFWELAQNRCR